MSTSAQDNQVKAGYAELDSIGRAAVRVFIEEFEKANDEKKRSLTEGLNSVFNKSLGPKSSSVCPCCGR
jgi:hypothetical protein